MNEYQTYANKVEGLEKSLTGMLGLKLTYIKSKSDGIDSYVNFLSSNFFPKKEKISQYDIEERISIIETALQEYRQIEDEIKDNGEIAPNLKKFLTKRILESKNKSEIAKRSIFFEAEKFGYDILFEGSTFEIKKNQDKIKQIGLNKDFDKQKQNYIKEIDNLQTEIYGPKISEVENEKNIVMSICNEKYQKNKQKLSPEEQNIFESFLEKFKNNIGKAPKDGKKLPPRGNLSMNAIMLGTEHIKQTFYPNIDWGQTKEKGKTGYAVPFERKIREYPDKPEDNFNKILTTIGHEDAGHMVRGSNQEKNGLIIPGAGYEDIEEGITKLNEGLLKYSLDEYPFIPNDTFIAVFIGENYNFEETYNLLKILKKIQNSSKKSKEEIDIEVSKSAFNLTQRTKCYYPRDEKGSNRKDVIYFRGERKIIEYLRSLKNDEERANFYRKLMTAKVSFEDIFTIDELLDELETSTKDTNQNKLVDKVFNVKLEKGASAFSKSKGEDGKTNIEKNLLDNDFRFRGMSEYIQAEKKALVGLFSMVKYKKWRGKYIQEEERKKLKDRDNLKKRNIVSVKTDEGRIKGKIIGSNLTELKILLQENGNYHSDKIITIKKKDKDKLKEVRILNKQHKQD